MSDSTIQNKDGSFSFLILQHAHIMECEANDYIVSGPCSCGAIIKVDKDKEK